MKPFSCLVDEDDSRAINAAIAYYQVHNRWDDEDGGILIPEGESDLAGAVLGEICRGWLEWMERENSKE